MAKDVIYIANHSFLRQCNSSFANRYKTCRIIARRQAIWIKVAGGRREARPFISPDDDLFWISFNLTDDSKVKRFGIISPSTVTSASGNRKTLVEPGFNNRHGLLT